MTTVWRGSVKTHNRERICNLRRQQAHLGDGLLCGYEGPMPWVNLGINTLYLKCIHNSSKFTSQENIKCDGSMNHAASEDS